MIVNIYILTAFSYIYCIINIFGNVSDLLVTNYFMRHPQKINNLGNVSDVLVGKLGNLVSDSIYFCIFIVELYSSFYQ